MKEFYNDGELSLVYDVGQNKVVEFHSTSEDIKFLNNLLDQLHHPASEYFVIDDGEVVLQNENI